MAVMVVEMVLMVVVVVSRDPCQDGSGFQGGGRGDGGGCGGVRRRSLWRRHMW